MPYAGAFASQTGHNLSVFVPPCKTDHDARVSLALQAAPTVRGQREFEGQELRAGEVRPCRFGLRATSHTTTQGRSHLGTIPAEADDPRLEHIPVIGTSDARVRECEARAKECPEMPLRIATRVCPIARVCSAHGCSVAAPDRFAGADQRCEDRPGLVACAATEPSDGPACGALRIRFQDRHCSHDRPRSVGAGA